MSNKERLERKSIAQSEIFDVLTKNKLTYRESIDALSWIAGCVERLSKDQIIAEPPKISDSTCDIS